MNDILTKKERLRTRIVADVLLFAKDGHVIVPKSSVRGPLPTGGGGWTFDFRAALLSSDFLNDVAESFWDLFGDRYPFQVCGLETAGIPLAAAVVMKGRERGTPIDAFFVRKSRKRTGLLKIVEGAVNELPVIIIDDLINSGQTLNKNIDTLKEAGHTPTGFFSILTFSEPETYAFPQDPQLTVRSLFTLKDFGVEPPQSEALKMPSENYELLWHFKTPRPSLWHVTQKSSLALDAHAVYVGGDNGLFYSFDQQTGKELWSFKIGLHPPGKGIMSNPAVYQEKVFFGAYDGNVYALKKETGQKIWSYQEADWVGSSPALAPEYGLLFVGLEFGLFRRQGGIVALGMENGKEMWQYRIPGYVHSSPLYIADEDLVVIGSNNGAVYAFSAKRGSLRWTYQTAGDIKESFSYDKKNRTIHFGSYDGNVYALSAKDGSLNWSFTTGIAIHSNPCVADNKVYFGGLDKRVYALGAQNGEVVWVSDTAGRIFSNPAHFAGSLWIGSNDGRLYEFDIQNGKKRSFFQVTERVINTPCYNADTGAIFFQTVANETYCVKRIHQEKTG